jgi:hypothetical protein
MTMQNRYAFRIRPRMRRGLCTEVPLPTRLVSNEEFPPQPQTAAQQEVEHRILAEAGRLARGSGLAAGTSCGAAVGWQRRSSP